MIDWRGAVAVILALGVVASVVILAVSELDHGSAGHITETEATLLSTILGAAVGALSAYMGARASSSQRPLDEREIEGGPSSN